jgi:choline monooxygenase
MNSGPYHGWTYTLEGQLKKATKIAGIQDFKAKDYGLKPMKVKVWGPWVFIQLGKSCHHQNSSVELNL